MDKGGSDLNIPYCSVQPECVIPKGGIALNKYGSGQILLRLRLWILNLWYNSISITAKGVICTMKSSEDQECTKKTTDI